MNKSGLFVIILAVIGLILFIGLFCFQIVSFAKGGVNSDFDTNMEQQQPLSWFYVYQGIPIHIPFLLRHTVHIVKKE